MMKNKILIIDDEPQWVESLSQLLQLEDYEVVTAIDASDAMKAVEEISDLRAVLTDLVLPYEKDDVAEGSVGVQLLKSIRLKRPDLPIIVVSGYLEPHAKELAAFGVSAVVSKGPGTVSNLRLSLQRAIETPAVKIRPELSDVTILEGLQKALIDEIDRYSPLKEKTISIPQEGFYELIKPLIGFKRDIERQITQYPFSHNVFLMMKFRDSNKELSEYIVENLSKHGLYGVRADHEQWNIPNNVYNPIAVLYCCKYGIALFDEPEEHQAYSPNVAYELGMMHYQEKVCLILRHESLPIVPFDLIKDLYVTYERDLQVREIMTRWMKRIHTAVEIR